MTLHQAVTVSLSHELCALMLMIASIQLMINFNIQHISLCDQAEYSTYKRLYEAPKCYGFI